MVLQVVIYLYTLTCKLVYIKVMYVAIKIYACVSAFLNIQIIFKNQINTSQIKISVNCI